MNSNNNTSNIEEFIKEFKIFLLEKGYSRKTISGYTRRVRLYLENRETNNNIEMEKDKKIGLVLITRYIDKENWVVYDRGKPKKD